MLNHDGTVNQVRPPVFVAFSRDPNLDVGQFEVRIDLVGLRGVDVELFKPRVAGREEHQACRKNRHGGMLCDSFHS